MGPYMRRRHREPLLLNKKAAAFELGISQCSLDNLVRTGQLASVRIGTRVLFLREVLAQFALERLERRHCRTSREASSNIHMESEFVS
jgi:hypothetical protein